MDKIDQLSTHLSSAAYSYLRIRLAARRDLTSRTKLHSETFSVFNVEINDVLLRRNHYRILQHSNIRHRIPIIFHYLNIPIIFKYSKYSNIVNCLVLTINFLSIYFFESNNNGLESLDALTKPHTTSDCMLLFQYNLTGLSID